MLHSNKNIHIGLSIFKLVVGLVVLFLVGKYIDPFQDPGTGVIIGSIGLLFFIWGLSYFIFYYAGVYWTDRKLSILSSYAYRASLLVALYVLTNIICIIIEFRTVFNGIVITAIFGLLYGFLFHSPAPEQNTSIDMIIKINDDANNNLIESKSEIKPKQDETVDGDETVEGTEDEANEEEAHDALIKLFDADLIDDKGIEENSEDEDKKEQSRLKKIIKVSQDLDVVGGREEKLD